jgi:hypothetical protein
MIRRLLAYSARKTSSVIGYGRRPHGQRGRRGEKQKGAGVLHLFSFFDALTFVTFITFPNSVRHRCAAVSSRSLQHVHTHLNVSYFGATKAGFVHRTFLHGVEANRNCRMLDGSEEMLQ